MVIGLLGCNSVWEVSTNGLVQKRKYQKGYHLDKFHNRTTQLAKQAARFKDTMPDLVQTVETAHLQLEATSTQERGEVLYAGPGLPAKATNNLSAWLEEKMPADTFEYYRPNPVVQEMHKNATTSKILGIVGLSTFFPLHLFGSIFPLALIVITPLYLALGIIGISLARNAKREIARDPHLWKGMKAAKTGLVLNWITTGLAIGMFLLLVVIVLSLFLLLISFF